MLCNFIILLAIITTVAHATLIKPSSFELEGRIVGGKNTTIESHPYMVSVRMFTLHFCGGSIVSKRVILTAAHCLFPTLPANSHSVQYGSSVIGGSNNTISAERVLRNENYNNTNYNNDVGLVFLVSEIPFNFIAQSIQLASQAPAAGVSAVITGWGTLSENGSRASILQEAVVEVIDRSICQERYKGINRITLAMLCASVNEGGKDACKLDSGGPLVRSGQLIGVISHGYGCGNTMYPGVYSNVAAFKSWIDSNITS